MGAHQVLIVEPSATLRRVCAQACESCGAEVSGADDVVAALGAITRHKPHVVLTALELPGLHGAALLAALRVSPDHRAIPVGLLTSSEPGAARLGPFQPDRILLKNAGLARSIEEFLGSVGIQPPAADVPRAISLRGCVLLAEDVAVNRLLISRLLHVAGAEVVVAENGAEAVEAARAQRFDLILMDIEMPIMDGREAVTLLRQGGLRTPILALTGHDPQRFRPEALSLGFTGVLEKGRDRAALVSACASLMSKLQPGS